MNQAGWRKWHRWAGFIGGVFLCFASITGVIVAMTEFFGEEEALRETTRNLTSPVTTATPSAEWQVMVQRAVATAARTVPGAPIDRVQIQFKGERPAVTIFLGKPGGGEDRRLLIDAGSGALLATESYVDKPLIHRIHSGEFLGDGGLVAAMLWGAVLTWLSASGLYVYVAMRRRNPTGWQRVFW